MSLFGCRFCPYYDKPGSSNYRLIADSGASKAIKWVLTKDGADCMLQVLPLAKHLKQQSSNTSVVVDLSGEVDKNSSFYVDENGLTEQERAILAYYTCPRANFDSLLLSLFTVLQVFTQDAWSMVLTDGIYYGSDWAGLYFVALVTIGNYVLFNLLVAILVEGFSESGEEEKKSPTPEIEMPLNQELEVDETSETGRSEKGGGCCKSFKNFFRRRWNYSLFILSKRNIFRKYLLKFVSSQAFDNIILVLILANCLVLMVERPSIEDGSFERQFLNFSNYFFNGIFLTEALLKIISFGFILGDNAYLKNGWNIMDGMLVACSTTYSIFSFFEYSGTKILGIFRVLRLLRALRPLRVIHRAAGVRIVVETLLQSIKPIGNVIIICLTFFLIFAILGVQLFKGCFFECQPPEIGTGTTLNSSKIMGISPRTELFSPDLAQLRTYMHLYDVKTKDDCLAKGFEWENESLNFDNILQALMTLFVFSTFDGWVDITRDAIDCVGIDMQPIRDYNPWNAAYFISFLLIVCFFVLNMFVGVVVYNFQKVQERVHAEVAFKRIKLQEEKMLRRLKRRSELRRKSKQIKTTHQVFLFNCLCF